MPNWCSNYLKVMGNCSDLKQFISDVTTEKSKLDFNKLLPVPKELLQHSSPNRNEKLCNVFVEKYGASDWYNWCVNNWGTKWSPVDTSDWKIHDDTWADIAFDTAWSPPIQFFKKISSKFPTLEFILSYEETGMGFAGDCTIKNGDVNDYCYDCEPAEECEYLDESIDTPLVTFVVEEKKIESVSEPSTYLYKRCGD